MFACSLKSIYTQTIAAVTEDYTQLYHHGLRNERRYQRGEILLERVPLHQDRRQQERRPCRLSVHSLEGNRGVEPGSIQPSHLFRAAM